MEDIEGNSFFPTTTEIYHYMMDILIRDRENVCYHDPHMIIKHIRRTGGITRRDLYPIYINFMKLSARRFGAFGGRYVSHTQSLYLNELEKQFASAIRDLDFWKHFVRCGLVNETPLVLAKGLTEEVGGANIWLKREDNGPCGSHKIRNIVGQVLLARRMDKAEMIMACGYAGHGIVLAAACQKFGLKCTIFMGTLDIENQMEDIYAMQMRGASVIFAEDHETGYHSMHAAMKAAHLHAEVKIDGFLIFNGPIGAHPQPTIHRFFQSLLGEETKEQCGRIIGAMPDAIVVPVGMGSGAVGMFTPFKGMDSPEVKLLGVQPVGAAPLFAGSLGYLWSSRSYLLRGESGKVLAARSHAEDLRCPTVGPEVGWWKSEGKAQFVEARDKDAEEGVELVRRLERFVPSWATAYAVKSAMKLAAELGQGKNVVLLVSGKSHQVIGGI